MANCPYCHQNAGLLNTEHAECRTAAEAIATAVSDAGASGEVVDLKARSLVLAKQSPHPVDVTLAIRSGFGRVLDRVLDDGVIDEDEEKRLDALLRELNLSQEAAPSEFMRMVKAVAIRELLNGTIPQRLHMAQVPVQLQKNEQVVWAFPGTDLLEPRVQRSTTTVGHGLSIRIARGLYYRPSVFNSTPVERAYMATVGRGTFILTNKNIYFASSTKTMRIPYGKVVAFEPFKDGIGIHRDAASAKPQFLVNGDGWFTYNMATNLARLATSS